MIIDRIAAESGLTPSQVGVIIRSSGRRYKSYTIPKRDGGRRHISQPSRKLKFIQRWLISRVFSLLPVHECATAYVRGRGIADNAQAHRHSRYLLKTDIANFFPSITDRDVRRLIRDNAAYLPDDIAKDYDRIAMAVSYRGALTIGAPSSPTISNTMLYAFDVQMQEYCEEAGLSYTRYADDIAVSAIEHGKLEPALDKLREIIESLEYPKLELNEAKTVMVSKKHRRFVTGLVLTSNGKVSIGRDRKREIRSLLFRFKNGELNSEAVDRLKGWCAYINSVEPEFSEALKRKYGVQLYQELMDVDVE